MQQDLVEQRHWVTKEEYLEGLALSQLAPGPLGAQLAMHLGYIRGGLAGASIVGLLFILPSFLLVWAISLAYVAYGGLAWMQAVFSGVGAAVIGIIARSAWRLARLTLGHRVVLWGIFVVLAISTALTQREIPWLFLTGGLVGLVATFPSRSTAVVAVVSAGIQVGIANTSSTSIPSVLWFFAKAGPLPRHDARRTPAGAVRVRAAPGQGEEGGRGERADVDADAALRGRADGDADRAARSTGRGAIHMIRTNCPPTVLSAARNWCRIFRDLVELSAGAEERS